MKQNPDEDFDTTRTPSRPFMVDGVPVSEIVTRIRAGDTRALARLHDTLYIPLWRLTHRLVRSSAIAEEIIQDVFFALWRRRETLRVEDDLRSYLYAAVRNRARDYHRHERVVLATEATAQHAPLDMQSFGTAGLAPDEAVDAEGFQRAYREALSTLSEREALALFLRWEDEMTLEQIGHVLGVSIEGTRKIVVRAQKKLQVLLRKYRG